jgi:glycerol-3-phosphate dehydrogenase
MYDFVAGRKTIKSSYYLGKSNSLELFPMLKGDKLKGAIIYYDGMAFLFLRRISKLELSIL